MTEVASAPTTGHGLRIPIWEERRQGRSITDRAGLQPFHPVPRPPLWQPWDL